MIPVSFHEDYKSLAATLVFHARFKHIELDLHFVRGKVLRNDPVIQYIPSAEQIADIFIKHLPSAQFFLLQTKLSVVLKTVHFPGGVGGWWWVDNQQHFRTHRNNFEATALDVTTSLFHRCFFTTHIALFYPSGEKCFK